ncbi:hypothetical protein LIER_30509 [Lithospermum erythrorhizon]|uniref:Uncharacterized protein n=1 Tax=Lithospermum erythrorhizon TaxID=34254 RepID=A0AAV3RMW5_LITER
MHQRFNVILNNLQSLGKEFSREEINGKIFEALNDDYDRKICAIIEVKYIGTIPLQELIGSLKTEEEVIAYKKVRRKNKKSLALVVVKAEKLLEVNDIEVDGDDELVMLAKSFKSLPKNKSNSGKYPQESKYDNYEKRRNTKEYVSYKNNKSKKYTWEYDVTEEGSDFKVEISNDVCLMGNDSMEVSFYSDSSSSFECSFDNEPECECKNYNITYTELNEANDRKLDDYSKLMDKYKKLSLNNHKNI